MKKLILALILLTSPLLAHTWKHVSSYPIPIETEVIFYDSLFDELYIGQPEDYIYFCAIMLEITPEVLWWMPRPSTPKELGLMDAER